MIRWGPELTEDSDALKKAKARLAAKVESPRPWEAPPTPALVAVPKVPLNFLGSRQSSLKTPLAEPSEPTSPRITPFRPASARAPSRSPRVVAAFSTAPAAAELAYAPLPASDDAASAAPQVTHAATVVLGSGDARRAVCFGGVHASGLLAPPVLHVFEPSKNGWSQPSVRGKPPTPRAASRTAGWRCP